MCKKKHGNVQISKNPGARACWMFGIVAAASSAGGSAAEEMDMNSSCGALLELAIARMQRVMIGL